MAVSKRGAGLSPVPGLPPLPTMGRDRLSKAGIPRQPVIAYHKEVTGRNAPLENPRRGFPVEWGKSVVC